MKGHVLLIDDSALDLKIAASVLEREGFDCHCFTDYKEALAWADTETPQLIFLDLQMPDINGYDLIPVLKKHPLAKNTPIIIMSGRNQADDVKKAILTGASDYMIKPIDVLVLQEKSRQIRSTLPEQEFASVEVPTKLFKSAHTVNKIEILVMSEFGLQARCSNHINQGDTIEISGLPSDSFGSSSVLARCLHSQEEKEKKTFLTQFTYIGLTEAQRQTIRKLCRQLWIQTKEASR